ncbi:hypothetical protein BSL78_00472 [Apostichopus japonicus]|uniref:Uncharacterized protein n=1 Tax=Stichopus japonicus TaxID=307972 RepID=A0A2G8LQM7_STIJA|nr:hypothetical protein BSL78_00472 [Apostichopus japonicus]
MDLWNHREFLRCSDNSLFVFDRVAKENNPRRTAQHPYHRRSSHVLATSTPVRDNKNFEYLRKSGLPSLMDQMSSLKVARQVPSYMTMTKSAAGKKGAKRMQRELCRREFYPSLTPVASYRLQQSHCLATITSLFADKHKNSSLWRCFHCCARYRQRNNEKRSSCNHGDDINPIL